METVPGTNGPFSSARDRIILQCFITEVPGLAVLPRDEGTADDVHSRIGHALARATQGRLVLGGPEALGGLLREDGRVGAAATPGNAAPRRRRGGRSPQRVQQLLLRRG